MSAPALTPLDRRKPGARSGDRIASWVLTVVVALGAIAFVLPFLWLITAATHASSDILSSPPPLVPGHQLWSNLTGLFRGAGFSDALRNSFVVSLTTTAVGVAVCSAAGYAFAKFTFRGRGLLLGVLVGSLALPGQVTLVPLFKLMVELGWLNTYQALVLPNVALPFGVFLMRQAMQSVPDELLQAARVDGAGELRTFVQIVLPVMRPSLAALSIFVFLGQWNDFVYPLTVQRSPDAYTVPVALATLKGVGTTDYGQLLTGTLVSIVPVLVVFLLLQRYFVAGLLSGAVKQ